MRLFVDEFYIRCNKGYKCTLGKIEISSNNNGKTFKHRTELHSTYFIHSLMIKVKPPKFFHSNLKSFTLVSIYDYKLLQHYIYRYIGTYLTIGKIATGIGFTLNIKKAYYTTMFNAKCNCWWLK